MSLQFAACGGSQAPVAAPTDIPTTAATATATSSDASELAPGKVVRSADGALSIRSSGGIALQVTLKRLTSPPAAPTGWTILDGAYDITARDRERAVTKLDSAIELSFRAPGGQAVVMFHDGTQWVIVESERAADGSLVAKTDHLTPYAVAQPSRSFACVRNVKAGPIVIPACLHSRKRVAGTQRVAYRSIWGRGASRAAGIGWILFQRVQNPARNR